MGYEAALSDYEKLQFDDGRRTRDFYKRGTGPAVIVIHEMPGLNPLVIAFADRLAASGLTVFLPNLFGEAGRPSSPGYLWRSVIETLCVRREFHAWSTDRSSPIVDWLRALARKAYGDCGGRGVGAIGMCFTGGFALAMMTEPAVVAPVLSQPSLPLAMGSPRRAAAIGCSRKEIDCARRRCETEDLTVLGLRFKSDVLVPDARFETYRRELGERFEAVELEDADAAPSAYPPHSVLTLHLKEDGPTKAAEQRVIAFFKARTGA